MNIKSSGLLTVIIFLGISIVSCLCLVFGSTGIWGILTAFKLPTNFISGLMTTIEAIATAVAAAAVFGAGYIAYQEIKENSKSRHIEVADRLFNELNSEKNIKARRRIFNLKSKPGEMQINLVDEDRDAIKSVLNSLDRVAFLTQPGWIPDELVMPWMHPMIAKSWEKLEPYVLYERERRNEPYYYEHAGELAERCRKWRARHLAETDTKWTDDAL